MKKIVAAICIAVLPVFLSHAQAPFERDDIVISAGVGIGGRLSVSGATVIPPLFAAFEYCVADRLFDSPTSIGIGGLGGYGRNKSEGGGYVLKTNSILLGVKGTVPYNFVKKLDTYISVNVGYNFTATREIGVPRDVKPSYRQGGMFGYFNLGARYYFFPYLALFCELGFDVGYFNLGVAFKL